MENAWLRISSVTCKCGLRRSGNSRRRIYQEWKGGMDWKNITLIVGQQTCEEFFLLMFL